MLAILLGTPQISFGLTTGEWIAVILTITLPIITYTVVKAMLKRIHEVGGDDMIDN